MKSKLLKRIRKEYHIAITERKFIKGNDTYVDHWSYGYSFASKKGTRANTSHTFELFMFEFFDYPTAQELFKARQDNRKQRKRAKELRAIHENTLNKISSITK